MENKFEKLDWDTDFFGFKVVKIEDNCLNEDPQEFFKELYLGDVHLAYYTSTKSFSAEVIDNQYYHIELVSKRVPILKEMTNKTEIHKNISFYNEPAPSEDLVSLALLAGRQGRFGQDPRILENTYRNLFRNWITNSVNKNIADEVLVYRDKGKIVGFATIKVAGDKGYAPLLAVDRDHEGQGVSFALMRAIETRLIENNCTYVLSGTQEINKKALATFRRYGLRPQAPQYVYHLWRK